MNISTIFRSMALAVAAIGVSASASAADGITLNRSVKAFYEDMTSEVGNYYVLLSDNPTAAYNSGGYVTMTGAGYVLSLDLYAAPTSTKPIAFPAGNYLPGDGSKAMTYYSDAEVTTLYRFNEKGEATHNYALTGTVKVAVAESGAYTINLSAIIDGVTTPVTFNGSVYFDDPTQNYVWPQIGENIEMEITDAHAVYDGNLWESNTGEFYLYLYNDLAKRQVLSDGTIQFDITTPGAMRYAIMLFGKLFSKDSEPYIETGTYSPTRNFKRNTYYTGREIDYMGTTVPIGFYVQKRVPNIAADTNTAISYVDGGDVVIDKDEDGNYVITVDCVTTLGHTVKGTYRGPISVVDQRVEIGTGSHISTLENDVECDLKQIEVARLQYYGKVGVSPKCHSLILDIGSPSGKDQSVADNGGDIIRFEFLQSLDQPYLLEGTYVVCEEKYETYYAPFRLAHGHFSKEANGDLTGTRYMHFIPGRYMVMDHLAPAVEGTVSVVKNDDGNYTIAFELLDDANFWITGKWTGPVEYTYDAASKVEEAGIASVEASDEISFERMSRDRVFVRNMPAGAAVSVCSVSGAAMPVRVSDGGVVDLSGLTSGVYVITVNNKSFKLAK